MPCGSASSVPANWQTAFFHNWHTRNNLLFLFFIAIGIILKGTDGELMGIGGIIIMLISLIPEKDIEEDI